MTPETEAMIVRGDLAMAEAKQLCRESADLCKMRWQLLRHTELMKVNARERKVWRFCYPVA